MAIPDKSDYVFDEDQNFTNDVSDNVDQETAVQDSPVQEESLDQEESSVQESSSEDNDLELSTSASSPFRWLANKVSGFFSALQEKLVAFYNVLSAIPKGILDGLKSLIKDISVFSGWFNGQEVDTGADNTVESTIQSVANEADKESNISESSAEVAGYDDADDINKDLASGDEISDEELDSEGEELDSEGEELDSEDEELDADDLEAQEEDVSEDKLASFAADSNKEDAPSTRMCGAHSDAACNCDNKSTLVQAH